MLAIDDSERVIGASGYDQRRAQAPIELGGDTGNQPA
jgi:hypothetical protein